MDRPHFDFLEWQQVYNCSITKLDKHREKLVEIFNLMLERYNARTCKDNITEPFFKLAFNAESFFFDEELLLRQLNYPQLSDKKKKHKQVLARIVQFKEDFSTSKETVCMDMIDYLSDWIQYEIIEYDVTIVKFLKSRGVE